jgi:hypothetical protein
MLSDREASNYQSGRLTKRFIKNAVNSSLCVQNDKFVINKMFA